MDKFTFSMYQFFSLFSSDYFIAPPVYHELWNKFKTNNTVWLQWNETVAG